MQQARYLCFITTNNQCKPCLHTSDKKEATKWKKRYNRPNIHTAHIWDKNLKRFLIV